MAWVGRDLKDHESPTPLLGRATNLPLYQTRLPRASSNLALNTSRDGASTTSLGSLCQHLPTFSVKSYPLISNLNLSSLSLKPFPLVLPLTTLVKS